MMSRIACIAALAAGMLVSAVAHGNGVDPTKISLPKGPGSIEGLGRSFVPSLASGTASYGIDIAVPPAAGGFGPKLGLDYDAGGGVSEVGMGWRIGGTARIRRRTENGLPRFDASDAFEIEGVGVPCDLVAGDSGFFRPQFETGAFVRIQRSADGTTWEARDKSGGTSRFGGAGFTEQEGSHVASYLLREQEDLHGHLIKYTWDTSSGQAFLTHVTWNDFNADARNEVIFTYGTRPDPHVRFAAGIRQTLDKRLTTVEVKHGGKLVRRYSLAYASGVHSRLATVSAVGTDGVTSVPALKLNYTEASLTANGQVQAMTTPPGWSTSDGDVDLADLNGDGLPDLLVAKSGNYRSYVNHDGIAWKTGTDWGSASPSLALSTVGVQLADVDGDGAIDLVAKSGLDDFRFFPGKDALSFAPSVAIPTVPNFSLEDPDVKLADMDGDRRVDAVITTAAGLAIGYNLGGKDWAVPITVGEVDTRQPLRFSDGGHTQLCDVNGDRVLDFCYLTPGSLVYRLGRGRGVFEPAQTATGVPDFDPSSPWELHDLDGDGWLDLVHVGVTQVDYRLAMAAGNFGPQVTIAGTPEKLPTTTVRFADMNGSGTTDIVWIDVSGSSATAWQYLELFPEGRAGLLQKIDNGLGKVVTITYSPASANAAKARDAGLPWTSRMNVAMPVVARTETDVSLGDPTTAIEYAYENGTWDPAERTFAGFAGGTERDIGDDHTPTLLTTTTFDPGLVHRELRGAVLTTSTSDEQGYLFSRSTSSYATKQVAPGVEFSFKQSETVDAIEGADLSKARTTLTEYEQDDYGNATAERRWGEVVGADKLAGNDEAITLRTFASNTTDWILGRVATEELQDASGQRVEMSRAYYDGLPLGQVARGDVTRREAWVGPAADAFDLDITTKYDADGHPIETTDARGGGRLFTWDPAGHTLLLSESVRTGKRTLTQRATYDAAFGTLLTLTNFNDAVTSFQYDPLGRLSAVIKPGDSPERPTARYVYQPGTPLSRITTEARVFSANDRTQTSFQLLDGRGRARASFANDSGDRWAVSGILFFDARGNARRTLTPAFASANDAGEALLRRDGPGSDAWHDALGRAVRTRSQLGIETRDAFEPFTVKTWDGAHATPNGTYDPTPVIKARDGLGRLRTTTHSLGGNPVVSSYSYDAGGNLLARTDPEGNTARYAYDGRSRRVLVDDPDAGRHQFVFDALGNLIQQRSPDGKVRVMTYDLAGRALTDDWNGDGTPEVVRTYDEGGDLFLGLASSVSDPTGGATFAYDERQRLLETVLTIGGVQYKVGNAFDAQDRPYLHRYPDGSSIRIRYGARGLITGYGKDAVALAYDADGREMQRTFSSGVTEVHGYDDDRRHVEHRVQALDGALIQHLKWTLDPVSNVTELGDLRPGIAGTKDRSESYRYDNIYRLTHASGRWGKTSWQHSLSGNLLARTSTDPVQNADTMGYGQAAGPHALTGYKGRAVTYDSRGRMLSDGERSYTWDGADHLVAVATKGGASQESTFDAENRRRIRVEHDPSGNSRTTHFIDAWSEVRDGKLARYVVHAGQRIVRLADATGAASAPLAVAEGDGSGEPPPRASFPKRLVTCLWGLTSPRAVAALGTNAVVLAMLVALAWTYRRRAGWGGLLVAALVVVSCSSRNDGPPPVEDGTVQSLGDDDELLFSDALGSLTETTSARAVTKASSATFPFGLTRYDSSNESRKFANSPQDAGVGVDQMGVRAYVPELARWSSVDPVALFDVTRAVGDDAAMANPYAYAGARPTRMVDPKGMWGEGAKAWVQSHVAQAGELIAGVAYGGVQAVTPGGWVIPIQPSDGLLFQGGAGIGQTLVGTVKTHLGGAIFKAGIEVGSGGGTLSVGSAGTLSAVSVPAIVVGAAIASTGAALMMSGGHDVACGTRKAADAVKGLEARAKEIHGATSEATQRRTTIAVTETAEGTRVVSSSEKTLRPAQRAMLRAGEVEGVGAGHAEVTGVRAANEMGLTPTETGASRPICPNCARHLEGAGVRPASPLKGE